MNGTERNEIMGVCILDSHPLSVGLMVLRQAASIMATLQDKPILTGFATRWFTLLYIKFDNQGKEKKIHIVNNKSSKYDIWEKLSTDTNFQDCRSKQNTDTVFPHPAPQKDSHLSSSLVPTIDVTCSTVPAPFSSQPQATIPFPVPSRLLKSYLPSYAILAHLLGR